MRSDAPILVNILSTVVSSHRFAGTNEPIYARITAIQVDLNKVDLPPMFGPVTSKSS